LCVALETCRKEGDADVQETHSELVCDQTATEEETDVADPEAMEAILEALGFTPALVYEKRRQTWRLGKTEIVIDVLPFGLFMEIEGRVNEIKALSESLD
jgi:predicted adenylyl cyclase CyaB